MSDQRDTALRGMAAAGHSTYRCQAVKNDRQCVRKDGHAGPHASGGLYWFTAPEPAAEVGDRDILRQILYVLREIRDALTGSSSHP